MVDVPESSCTKRSLTYEMMINTALQLTKGCRSFSTGSRSAKSLPSNWLALSLPSAAKDKVASCFIGNIGTSWTGWIWEYVCIYILYLIYLSIDRPIHPSIRPSIHLSMHPYIHIYIYNYKREYIYIYIFRNIYKNKYK